MMDRWRMIRPSFLEVFVCAELLIVLVLFILVMRWST